MSATIPLPLLPLRSWPEIAKYHCTLRFDEYRPSSIRAVHEVLKVNATPTFFINAERIKGAISFEEFDKRIKQLLMK